MARVFITGSSDGLGLMAAKLLIEQSHQVVLHGRNKGSEPGRPASGSRVPGGCQRRPLHYRRSNDRCERGQ
jgi:NAD(P)-dependent dehydrogenase (short-subunit alcohol dehydrogenase family)